MYLISRSPGWRPTEQERMRALSTCQTEFSNSSKWVDYSLKGKSCSVLKTPRPLTSICNCDADQVACRKIGKSRPHAVFVAQQFDTAAVYVTLYDTALLQGQFIAGCIVNGLAVRVICGAGNYSPIGADYFRQSSPRIVPVVDVAAGIRSHFV